MSKKPYPKVRFVELDRPLKKQLEKYAQSHNLSLSVMYYIHDVGVLQDDITRSHYFLQVFFMLFNIFLLKLILKKRQIKVTITFNNGKKVSIIE